LGGDPSFPGIMSSWEPGAALTHNADLRTNRTIAKRQDKKKPLLVDAAYPDTVPEERSL